MCYHESVKNFEKFLDNPDNGKKCSKRVRRKYRLFIHQEGKCFTCNKDMVWCDIKGKIPHNFATQEHIKPRSFMRGKDGSNNYVLTCYSCNHERGILDLMVFSLAKDLGVDRKEIKKWRIAAEQNKSFDISNSI